MWNASSGSGAGPSGTGGGGRGQRGRGGPENFWTSLGLPPSIAESLETSFNSVLNFRDLTPRVQAHLRNVYLTLTGMMVLFTVGVLVQMNVPIDGIIVGIVTLASTIALASMQRTAENLRTRMGLLAVTAMATGVGAGNLVQYALSVNPMIVVQSGVGTILTFLSFSLSALTAQRRSWLFLGGGLFSFLNVTLVLHLLRGFMGWQLLDAAAIYIGLAVFVGYILFDTQMMVERAATSKGFLDPVNDSLQMFYNLLNIFKHLIVILLERENQRRRAEEEERRRKNKRG